MSKAAPEAPKVMVRVRMDADTKQYVADVRTVGSGEEETAAKAEGYTLVDPPPAPPFAAYPKWVYQAKGAQRRVVQNEDELKKLEGSWGDVPVDEAQEETDKAKAEREKREHEAAPRSAADPVKPEERPARARS